jgi:tetratricopeptide (TPR) repeat protein
MTSLDGDDITLSKIQHKALFEVLLSAFTMEELERLLAHELGLRLAHITPVRASGQEVVYELLHWLERKGRVAQFVEAAQRANPGNARLQALAGELGFAVVGVTSTITNLPPPRPHFTGRAAQMESLLALAPTTTTAIIHIIAGLGGVGKSRLMLEFAHRQREAYDIIWWLRVDEALAEDLLMLGRQLELPLDGLDQAAAVQQVRIRLNGTPRKWLLLCDNADQIEPRDLLNLLPHNPAGRILITSRNPHWRSGHVLRLDVFTDYEAAAFWQEWLGTGNEAARAELAHELGHLPLAMEHAAAYMAENGIGARAYLVLFQARRQDLWQAAPLPDDYHATITTTWELAFDQIRRTPGAADLLNLCCFLAADNIPLELFSAHAGSLPDPLAAIVTDPIALNKAIAALGRYSLLARKEKLLAVHRLVQTVARDRMASKEAVAWAEAAVELIYQALPDWRHLHEWAAGGQLLSHLESAANLAAEQGVESARLAELDNFIGFYLDFRGDYAEARPYLERALAIREKALGPDHPDTAQSLNNLGYLLQATGDLAEVRPYYERALAIFEKALGPDHPDTATTLLNLGHLLQAMGVPTEARPYFERALATCEKVLGPDHPDTAIRLTNLGALLQAMGNLSEARPYFERALAICEKALGPDHPDTAISLTALGNLRQAMGDLVEARPYTERALAIWERVLGPDHPYTALSLNNLGGLLQLMGDLAAARPYFERALAIREKALGPHHSDTAVSHNNLGHLLDALGDLAEARPYYERALAIFEKALGPDHPNTALSLNNLGALLQAMGDLQGARPYFERALAIREKALGPDHPDTATSLNNLGMLLKTMGDLAGARPYFERALAIFTARLGPDHPHTHTVRRNLATLADTRAD